MRAITVNESMSAAEKREKVMQILKSQGIESVPHDSYLKFYDLSLTDLSPKRIAKKLLQESINFEKGQDPKRSMNIGVDAKIMNFLEQVKKDPQLNNSNPEYSGFVNMADDLFGDERMREGHRLFVDNYEKYLPIMKEMGLYMLEPPWPAEADYEETIIYDDIVLTNPDYKDHPVLESVNFERGKEPKTKMGVGIKDMEGYVKMALSEKFPEEDPDYLEEGFWDFFMQMFEDDSGPEVAEKFIDWMQENLPLKSQMNYINGDLAEYIGFMKSNEDEG